jgi:hypothetical protein
MPEHAESAMVAAPPQRLFDVFNGDADGICALHQLRLASPADATLVTGVKREIDLLRRVPCEAGIEVTVLDISLDTNLAALTRLLDAGARVSYYDHHAARHAFKHPGLRLTWDDAPDICTSLLVDRHLNGRYRPWAIAAAFGDNLDRRARELAAKSGFDEHAAAELEALGQLLNYNTYGDAPADLHVPPETLYRELHAYVDPFEFIAASPCFRVLADGYRDDASRVAALAPHREWDNGAIYVLPDAPWARRISGTFANRLAAERRAASYAVLTESADGSYCVSIRSGAPQARPANELCARFAGGGGRRAAGGINALPAASLGAFVDAFSAYFSLASGDVHVASPSSSPLTRNTDEC